MLWKWNNKYEKVFLNYTISTTLIITMLMGYISCGNNEDIQKYLYNGEDISQDAVIICDKITKTASIQIETQDEWKLFSGTNTNNIDFSRPILLGKGCGTFPIESQEKSHHVFLLETKDGRSLFSDKQLPMEGGYNIRDLGGIKTSDGHFVKWGKVFRGDELGGLTHQDWSYLATIPIVSIIDFRSSEEVELYPDNIPEFISNQYLLSITVGNLDIKNMNILNDPKFKADLFMADLNIHLVSDKAVIEQYRKFFNILQNSDSAPLIFHCTAGKDRTGMGAALFLFSLGVDEESIINDYMESNVFLQEKYKKYIEDNPSLKDLLTVKRTYIQSGFNLIKSHYGSIGAYLKDVLDVNIETMKELYFY